MRSLLLMIGAILILACGTEEEAPVQETLTEETPAMEETDATAGEELELYVIQDGAAGLFGMDITPEEVEEIALLYGNVTAEEIDLMIEGSPYPAIELTFINSGTVLLELGEYDSTVFRIQINSELFKTAEGIGIGSTYDVLEANYLFDGIAWGDGGEPLVIVEEAGLSFFIEPGDWWQMGDVEGEIPGDTEVTAIILW
ncbi:MAG: hypothetical protein KAH54_08675 [Candidatus Sabulitectum sp.]|nr:hypothetical protein [Candidatus Sabulitectum sp.]